MNKTTTVTTYWKPEPQRFSFSWFALLIPAIIYSVGVIVYAHNAFVPGLTGENGHALGSALMVFGGEAGTLAAAAEVFRKQADEQTNAWDWGGLGVSLVATLGNLFVVYVSLSPDFNGWWVDAVRINGPLVLLICSGVDFYAGIMEFGYLNASFNERWEKWNNDRHTWLQSEKKRQQNGDHNPLTVQVKTLQEQNRQLIVKTETLQGNEAALQMQLEQMQRKADTLQVLVDDFTSEKIEAEAQLDERAMQILELMTQDSNITQTAIAKRLQVSRPTVKDRIEKLVKAGKLPQI